MHAKGRKPSMFRKADKRRCSGATSGACFSITPTTLIRSRISSQNAQSRYLHFVNAYFYEGKAAQKSSFVWTSMQTLGNRLVVHGVVCFINKFTLELQLPHFAAQPCHALGNYHLSLDRRFYLGCSKEKESGNAFQKSIALELGNILKIDSHELQGVHQNHPKARHRIVAFEAPLHERRALRKANVLYYYIEDLVNCGDSRRRAFPVRVLPALTRRITMCSDKRVQLFMLLAMRWSKENVQVSGADRSMTFTRWEDAFARYLMAEIEERPRSGVLVLITYRSKILLPLCMASARRAVKFVNAVVAPVTANAYVSTLGGGHFLCCHVNQSTLLAKVGIGISMGLHDPILEL
ncbi:hypothetical protein PsorP6_004526 [Peronosclerospora sorghi]|uniref:Uncharacterized protein n=1 Tax=Peronosclerospora sorghi TaxID=230839 RepID=A0ACC0VK00_9STRA|nr:hypothetical protein PsorP6_004526 [Peronosclerospora sorghi]